MALLFSSDGVIMYNHPDLRQSGELDIDISDIPDRVPTETVALSLSGNSITEIPIGVFSHLRRCQNIDISINSITELRKGMFKGLSAVHWMSLKRNQISYIGPRAFVHLRKCKELILAKNRITEIQPATWVGLVSLWYLDLKNNKIRGLQSKASEQTEGEQDSGTD